jgi:hypothetical protein
MNIAVSIYYSNHTEYKIIFLKRVPKKIRDILLLRLNLKNSEIVNLSEKDVSLLSKSFIKFNFEKNELDGFISIKVIN